MFSAFVMAKSYLSSIVYPGPSAAYMIVFPSVAALVGFTYLTFSAVY